MKSISSFSKVTVAMKNSNDCFVFYSDEYLARAMKFCLDLVGGTAIETVKMFFFSDSLDSQA